MQAKAIPNVLAFYGHPVGVIFTLALGKMVAAEAQVLVAFLHVVWLQERVADSLGNDKLSCCTLRVALRKRSESRRLCDRSPVQPHQLSSLESHNL